MRKALKLSVIMCIMIIYSSTHAQTATMSLNIFPNLSRIDFAAFSFERELTNQPRIMQIIIMPSGLEVFIEGSISWKRNESSGFQTVGTFITENFLSRSFFNDEIGSTDIKIKSSNYNSDLTNDLLKIGKPSGIIGISFNLFDSQGTLLSSVSDEILFLNPTPPEIILPISGSIVNIGSIPVMWTKSIGASSYRILANYIGNNETNYEQALNAGNPIVNNRDVGELISINLRDYLDREIVGDTNIVLVVRAVVEGPGGGEIYQSTPVVFSTTTSGESQTSTQTSDPLQSNLILLSNILSGQDINQNFLNDLASGKYSLDQLQFIDEYGNLLSFSDFQNIMNYLQSNPDAIISVKFLSQ